jgi:hypothetical protein
MSLLLGQFKRGFGKVVNNKAANEKVEKSA